MAATAPGTTSANVADAHYHALVATQAWSDFMAGVRQLATHTAATRLREDERRARATTYARGTLGQH